MTSIGQAVRGFRGTPDVAGRSERTREELQAALRKVDLLDDPNSWQVLEGTDGDAQLVGPDGHEVGTWREEHPYPELMARPEYEDAKRALQIELLKLQSWVKDTGRRIVILFEGRDAAGKGGTIQRFTEHLNPRGARVVALDKPTGAEQGQWYFQRYLQQLPTAGEIVLFDRSWYSRAVVEQVMGFCTDDEYERFMREVPGLERSLVDDGIHLVKLWFSVSRLEQRTRFMIRVLDPLRQWKLSPVDLASLERWDDYTAAKEAMFAGTDTGHAPWTVVDSNDKRRGRIEAMRLVLSGLDYTAKDADAVGTPDPLVVGRPQVAGSGHGVADAG
ncbi:polyphosphate kinase 2 [Pseudonocardia parietis]|uniref:ADP/GDP-polyphosphate phosphotransferase n=1 Tax=Pseudonocardia parietis TaxID=570936 RepID=A0ABS4VVD3_9PSEU|nr:polyphosphate kinase 2 [Pseudonocardia parietis]MBP2367866.1 polyphosphate kinase 2 [Pseudonocardia parietis]